MARIRNHPLVNKSIPVHGYIYDVKSGRLAEVPEASRIGGAASAKARRPAKAAKSAKATKAATSKGRKSGKTKAA